MKTTVTSVFLLLISICLKCQQGVELQKQLDELRSRIRSLEKENELLKDENRSNDSTVYCAIRGEIFDAITNLPQLDFDFKSTRDKIDLTGLFTKLMQANNPTSDILGFRFSEIIFSASEKHFKEVLKNEPDKKRFSQVICKIIDNPVVSSLAGTNPLTSAVVSIISTIAGFTTSRVSMDKEGGRIKDVSVNQEDAFDNRSIAAFRSELQVYIDFYDALILASQEYLDGLENLDRKYDYLILSVKDFKKELYTEIDVRESNLLIRLSALLPDPSIKGLDYKNVMSNFKVQQCLLHARKYPVLQQQVSDFKKEYNMLLYNFLSDYIKTLTLAENFPDNDIDKTRTGNLVKDIETFINSQKNKESEELDAFK